MRIIRTNLFKTRVDSVLQQEVLRHYFQQRVMTVVTMWWYNHVGLSTNPVVQSVQTFVSMMLLQRTFTVGSYTISLTIQGAQWVYTALMVLYFLVMPASGEARRRQRLLSPEHFTFVCRDGVCTLHNLALSPLLEGEVRYETLAECERACHTAGGREVMVD
jgi:hypothetical protein